MSKIFRMKTKTSANRMCLEQNVFVTLRFFILLIRSVDDESTVKLLNKKFNVVQRRTACEWENNNKKCRAWQKLDARFTLQ